MFPAQLSKHRCMGKVMKFLSPYLKSFLHYICRGYRDLFVLGKDIPLNNVFKHIFLSIVLFKSDDHLFLSIVLFNFIGDLYDLSSNILLLM